ncbi:bifunctional acetate--CoA ligase family protein/GNAT family N-acetyltransferase, partial [Dissulfurirhabdus thermomarina]
VGGVLVLAPDVRDRVPDPEALCADIRRRCARHGMRCMGPNSLGFIRPRLGLHVSPAAPRAVPGHLAVISQSSTLAAALLDHAAARHVGFSTFVSLGAQMDVDFADLVDFLGVDAETRCIALYLESVTDGRRFIRAARSFARTKPLIVVKGGRTEAAARMAFTHAGTLAGEDRVYDAVFRRCGMIRVDEVLDLFHVAEALAKQAPPPGGRLAIVTNGGGGAVLATDALAPGDGTLAELAPETLDGIRRVMPLHWRAGNPVDLLSDAPAERYAAAVAACLADPGCDGVLVVLAPHPAADPVAAAGAVAEVVGRRGRKVLLACWMGGEAAAEGRRVLARAGVPAFEAPEPAVRTFRYLVRYRENIRLLYETPANLLEDFRPDQEAAAAVFEAARREGRTVLTEIEGKRVLSAYGIPCRRTLLARTPDEALAAARRLGFPVAMKVISPEVVRKVEVGGRRLHVREGEVERVFEEIRGALAQAAPGAPFLGVAVQSMTRPPGQALAFGARKDPTFGTVIVFGAGADALPAVRDCAVGLPPLNQTLARRLLEQTRTWRFLEGCRHPALDLAFLEVVLLRFSHLVTDFACIREVEVNPFYLREREGVCLDVRMVLEAESPPRGRPGGCPPHLSVCPYPCHLTGTGRLAGGRPYTVRPIRPEDEPLMQELFQTFSPRTVLMRFFQPLAEITHEEMIRYCHVDYDREIALVAAVRDGGRERLIGVGRLVVLPDGETAEYAVVVGDPWQRQGVGRHLTARCLDIARDQGLARVRVEVLPGNRAMISLASGFGFRRVPTGDPDLVRLELDLRGEAEA